MAQHFSELINIQIIINYSVANHPGHDLHLYNQADIPPIESGEPFTNATLGPFPHAKLHRTDNQQITETLVEEPHF